MEARLSTNTHNADNQSKTGIRKPVHRVVMSVDEIEKTYGRTFGDWSPSEINNFTQTVHASHGVEPNQ